jgi:hypothetical protein
MKQLLRLCRRPLRPPRLLVFTVDRPRRIDRVIDFFGDGCPPAVLVTPRLKMIPRGSVCRD